MKNKNKNVNAKKYFWITLCVFALITTYYYATTDPKVNAFIRFDDRQIIGHSKEEIIEKYGEFDKVRIVKRDKEPTHKNHIKYSGLYKVARANDWGSFYEMYYYYWVLFSENDIAIDTKIGIPPDEQ